MLTFISGKITGTTDYMEKFERAEEFLKSKGYRVINPAKWFEHFDTDIVSYADFINISLMLIAKCDSIYSLSDWKDSYGAVQERKFAESRNFKIIEEQEGDFR